MSYCSSSVNVNNAPAASRASTLHNPFAGKILSGEGAKIEAKIRGVYNALQACHITVKEERPSVVVFFQSSGYPLYRIFKALQDLEGSRAPDALLLPMSSHNFAKTDAKEINANLKQVRKSTIAEYAKDVSSSIGRSLSPGGKIIVIDEVLSGAAVVGLSRSLRKSLYNIGVNNEIQILGVADQSHFILKQDTPEFVSQLLKNQLAFSYPCLDINNLDKIKISHIQITPDGFKAAYVAGGIKFKASSMDLKVESGKAIIYPVPDLFTTDNLDYNPQLLLDRTRGIMSSPPVEAGDALPKVGELVIYSKEIAALFQNSDYLLGPLKYFGDQPVPRALRNHMK